MKVEAQKIDVKTVSAALPIVEWDGETYGPTEVKMRFTLQRNEPASIVATPDNLGYVRAAYLAGGSVAQMQEKYKGETCCDMPKGAYLDIKLGQHGSIVAKRQRTDNKKQFLVA